MTNTHEQMLETMTIDQDKEDTVAQFTDVEKSATDAYNGVLEILRKEVLKPQYSTLTDEQVADKLNESIVETIIDEVPHNSLFEDVFNTVKNQSSSSYLPDLDVDPVLGVYVDEETFEKKLSRALKEAIKEDKYKLGFEGKSADDIKMLLKSPFTERIPRQIIVGSLVSQLFMGVSYAPNAVTSDDVAKARA